MDLSQCNTGKWIINTPLGSGKSRAIIQMAKEGKFKAPHLIIVDTKEEVNRYRSQLPEYDWYYQTDQFLKEKLLKEVIPILNQLKDIIENENYKELADISYKELENPNVLKKNTSEKGLIITKAMFNKYLDHQNSNFLSKFNTITIDELSNLNILAKFLFKDEYTCLLKDVSNSSNHTNSTRLQKFPCNKTENPSSFFEGLINNNTHAFLKRGPFKRTSEIYLKNTKLLDLLNSDNINIQILDGTANFNDYFYDSLEKYQRIDIETEAYANLSINTRTFDTGYTIKMSKLRIHSSDNNRTKNEKLSLIKGLNINSSLIFSNKDTIDALKDNGYHRDKTLDYYYSGNDIGTNKYQLYTDLTILYGQKINTEYTKMLSFYFNKDAEDIQSDLTAARTIQLIGRTAIRNNNPDTSVVIDIFNFPELDICKVLEYYRESNYKENYLPVTIEEVTSVGKVVQYIKKQGLLLDELTNKKIKAIISDLKIESKDTKSLDNLVYRVNNKLQNIS